jgi:hypothetical protein
MSATPPAPPASPPLSKQFLGLACTEAPPVLVARFQMADAEPCHYMTMAELCDWIEYQVASGLYHSMRAVVAVERVALLALIEAHRAILTGKKAYADYPALAADATSFAHYVMTAYIPLPPDPLTLMRPKTR